MTLNPRPHILHFSPLAVIGGCEVNCLRLIEGLAAYRHTVLVFSDRGPMSHRWAEKGANVEHLDGWDFGSAAFKSALSRWMGRNERPDGVLYWSSSRLPDVIEALAPWNVKTAVYLGNPIAAGAANRFRRIFWELSSSAPVNMTLVACSNYVAESHRRARFFRGFPITTIYNAVTEGFDHPREHRTLPPGSAPIIGMVARLDPIKDHATVIRALANISRTRPDTIVEFAGDGLLRGKLERLARELGVADRVRFLGFTEVGPLLARWDIYVHSTTPSEGMGTAVAEAMMAGVPCVVSEMNVMREVCGASGAVYAKAGDPDALANAVLDLVKDDGLRRRLGFSGQGTARAKFSLKSLSLAYERVITHDGSAPVQKEQMEVGR